MIFHETRRLMGRALPMDVGAPTPPDALRALPKGDVAAELRRRVMRLGGVSDEVFVWPARLKW